MYGSFVQSFKSVFHLADAPSSLPIQTRCHKKHINYFLFQSHSTGINSKSTADYSNWLSQYKSNYYAVFTVYRNTFWLYFTYLSLLFLDLMANLVIYLHFTVCPILQFQCYLLRFWIIPIRTNIVPIDRYYFFIAFRLHPMDRFPCSSV